MNTTQLIWTGNEYEEADRTNSEVPDWPVQDAGAHWHHRQFDGQRARFHGSDVDFGFEAEEVPEEDIPHNEDGTLNLNDLYLANNGSVYKSI